MYKDLLNKINFIQGMYNCFINYSKNLDNYFKNEENRKNHNELYNYYINLMFDLDNLKKKGK